MPEEHAKLEDHDFEIAVRRLADSLDYGSDASPYVGAGVDYAQSRPFVDGDPVRDIDWKVTARTARFHVKEYEVLKSMPIYLLVDTSASMNFTSQTLSKYDVAVRLAGALALAGMRRHSPVGILGCGDRRLHFAPSLSRRQIFQWLHELRRRRFDEGTNLARRVEEVAGILRCRCLVIIISDLHDREAVSTIKRMGQRHDGIVLRILDPAERGRLRAGFFRAMEAETGTAFVAHGGSRWFGREGVQQKGHALTSAGIDYLPLWTDRSFITALRQFLNRRDSLWRNTR